MRKISLLATTLILIGVGVWANTTNPTPHDAPVAIPVGPSQVMMNANDIPTLEFVACTYIFPVDCSPVSVDLTQIPGFGQ